MATHKIPLFPEGFKHRLPESFTTPAFLSSVTRPEIQLIGFPNWLEISIVEIPLEDRMTDKTSRREAGRDSWISSQAWIWVSGKLMGGDKKTCPGEGTPVLEKKVPGLKYREIQSARGLKRDNKKPLSPTEPTASLSLPASRAWVKSTKFS